jgi:hypothetical protein
MNARFRLSIVALCIAAILAGCGSVTNGLAFQPPSGWTGTPALFGHMQAWVKSGQQKNSTQFVMLVKGNAQNTKSDFDAVPSQYAKNTNVISRGSVKLCGMQPADQVVAEGTDRDGRRSHIEMVSTVIDRDRYVAMYIRPVNLPADASAESAIHSLCPLR